MSLEMQLEAMILGTGRPQWREFGDAIGGHGRGNLEGVIELVWRCTRRPPLSEMGAVLGDA